MIYTCQFNVYSIVTIEFIIKIDKRRANSYGSTLLLLYNLNCEL